MDVVVIGGTRWSEEVNQPPQQAVRALADLGHRVFYVYREHQGSALRNLFSPVDERGRRGVLGSVFSGTRFRAVGDSLWVAPIGGLAAALPMSHPEAWRRRLARRLQLWLEEEAVRLQMSDPVYWFYWWFLPELATGAPGATLYDVIDDHAAYGANQRLGRANERAASLEQRLLREVDVAFAVSTPLVESRSGEGIELSLLPNGISLERVRSALALADRPADVADLPHPLVGYVGDIGARFDLPLVEELAVRRPDWSFVLVGGEGAMATPIRPNLSVLPMRPYGEALRTMREFDVALLPLRRSTFNRSVSSLKLLDYLAVGRPVVATDLPFVHDVTDRWGGLVSIAEGAEQWERAIATRLGAPELPAVRAEREQALAARTVEARVKQAVTALATGRSAA
jgi:glycosyltransferase involved in cell wall biosynthesis